MKERMDEMFDFACTYQKDVLAQIKKAKKAKFVGINKEHFMATYRLQFGVGKYASERYYQDYKEAYIFIETKTDILTGKPRFKVNEDHYEKWQKDSTYTPF